MSGSKKVVLVTGCTKGGIGYSLACEFAAKGCQVFATARRLAAMEGLRERGLEILELDVTKRELIDKAVETVIARAGSIDILVNNAGTGLIGPLAELPIDEMRSVFETNVFGAVATAQAVFPYMVKQGGGRVVNIGSVVGWVATPWAGTYCASKSALHALTDSLRLEMKPFGIDVVSIQPGSIKSNLGSNFAERVVLREDSVYQPYSPAIRARATASQEPGATSTEEFASAVVAQVLKPKPPATFSYGRYSWMFYVLAFLLPTWLKDVLLARRFGATKRAELHMSKLD